MTERLVSKLHVALLSYDEREIRVRKNYLEEQNPAICCVCFHSGEELLRELRQQRSVDIVVLSSQLEDMDGYEFLKRLNSLHNRPLLLLQGDDWYSDATASFLRPDGRQYLPERSSLLDLLLDLRSSTDIGIFWVLPFCKQLYAEWGIQQPDVNCEYLTTALQVVCGTERKLAVRKEILQTVAEEHHTTVAAVDCGMRRLIDGVEKYNTEAWQKFKQDYGLAKESGMGDFPRKQFESVLLHSLRIMDQNREYLQMHLARTGDERTRQALEDMGQESIRLERTLREMMGLLEVEMNDKPSMKPVDLCWILMEAAQIAPEIEKQLGIRLTVDHSPFRRCYVKADAQEAEQLLFHLLSNALRAVSPGGQIKIRLTRDDEDLYLIVEDDGCGLPTGENWMENRRRFLGGVQAGLLLCRRYCAHMGWVLSLTPRGAGSGTRAEVRIPLAGTMFPIEGSVELHTIHPALTTADGLRWQILRELALLSDKME